MENNQITWQNQQNKTVVVTVLEHTTKVTVDGKIVAETMSDPFSPVPAAVAARAAHLGVVAFIGPVAVTAERKAFIEAKRAELFPPQAPMFREPDELTDLEDALIDARAWVLRHDTNPAPAYAAQAKAQAALDAWKAAHAEAWEAVATHRQAERDARKAERNDGVVRALRGED